VEDLFSGSNPINKIGTGTSCFRKFAEHVDPGFQFVLGPIVALLEDGGPS